jgi:hypothetical protein
MVLQGQGDLTMTFALSNHAATRVQQRGLPHHLIDALMSYADFEAPIGSGCTVLRMTRDRLSDPDVAACLGADRERLRGLSIVWSERTGEIVTVLRPRRGPAGLRYRRGG